MKNKFDCICRTNYSQMSYEIKCMINRHVKEFEATQTKEQLEEIYKVLPELKKQREKQGNPKWKKQE